MSPFLPGTQIQFAFDSTSLGWFKECSRKYYYSMIEGFRPRGIMENANLRFGLLYHAALEHYDLHLALGQDHEESLRLIVHEALIATWGWASDHKTKTRETLIRSIIWYADHFKNDPAETLILANGKPAVELSFRMELDWGPPDGSQPYLLCGHLDRIVNYQGAVFVSDRKTTSMGLGSYYFDQYEPDNQMSIYTIAGQVVFDAPVKGVIIDAAQILVGSTVFARGITYRTSRQLDEWQSDFAYWAMVIRGMAVSGHWPMNDKSCHKFGGCPFRPICSKDPSVRQQFLESNYVREAWNPLEVR